MLEAEEENVINKNSNTYKCEKCEYRSATQVCLMKYMNTKHALNSVKEAITEQIVVPKCALCDYNFNTFKKYEEHKHEHKDEIEEIDVTSLPNGLELF